MLDPDDYTHPTDKEMARRINKAFGFEGQTATKHDYADKSGTKASRNKRRRYGQNRTPRDYFISGFMWGVGFMYLVILYFTKFH